MLVGVLIHGATLTGAEAELPRLAALASQAPAETFRHGSELLRRGLVQQRSPRRAVLPHAIANWLAARALEDTPYDFIDQQMGARYGLFWQICLRRFE